MENISILFIGEKIELFLVVGQWLIIKLIVEKNIILEKHWKDILINYKYFSNKE